MDGPGAAHRPGLRARVPGPEHPRRRRRCLESADTAQAVRGYIWNLVRPMAFTFLRDCVRIGGLRLSESIAVVIDTGHPPSVDIELQRSSISPVNGNRLLFAL